jgi:hypothetical protein
MFTMSNDYDIIINLSDNMGNSKEELLSYIEYFNENTSSAYEDVKFLVQTQENLNMWFEFWNGNSEEVDETNWKLREWKIKQHLGSYEEFNDLLMIDQEDFIVTYFQQAASQRTMWELNRVLGEMNVRELWQIHSKYPMSRIEYL